MFNITDHQEYINPIHQQYHFANKGPYSQSYDFSNSHVQMWEVNHKGGWALKNWLFWVVVLEKTLESPLDSKEIKPVNPKGIQPWLFIGRIDTEAEASKFWPWYKELTLWKRRDAGKYWGQEEKGTTEDEMVGWHHRLNAHKFEKTPRDSEGQGSLACCSSQSCKELEGT